MIKFAGSMLVLSFAVNNISQLDDIADAYAKVIVLKAEASLQQCPSEPAIDKELLERIEKLEALSHAPTGK